MKKFFITIGIILYIIFQSGLCILAVTLLLSAFTPINLLPNLTPIRLDEETQAQLDKDTEHALTDAQTYLEEKYHTTYELDTFEPYIYFMTSDKAWVRTRYHSKWTGNFTIGDKDYEIQAHISENVFADNYQTELIRSAYEELIMQYFPASYEKNGIAYEINYTIGFKPAPDTWPHPGFFSAFYDGSNLNEMLKENGIFIRINIDENIEISDTFRQECENALTALKKNFADAEFVIID